MKRFIPFLALLLITGYSFAQKKTTTTATLSFDATTPKDALPKASNGTVIGSLDTKTGQVAFEAAVKNFSFSNPKMQEHFNGENWFKSDVFPVFTFSGKLEKPAAVKYNKNGVYKVTVKGQLTIRDVTRKEKISGTITVNNGKITVASNFSIKLKDYNITGQPIEAGKIATEPKIVLTAEFQ
jgi:polyisoprenoid-binding protein YceI